MDIMAIFDNIFDLMTIKSVLLVVIVFLAVFWWLRRPRNLPPGPWRLPIVGFFPQLAWYMYKGEDLHLIALKLGRKYGNLCSFDLFGYVFIVMNEFSVIKEANNNPFLSDKGHNNEVEKKLFGKNMHSYKHNGEYRKFALKTLRGFGIGKKSYEANIVTESKALIEELVALNQEPCNPHHYFTNTASNVLFAVVFGNRHEYNDEKFKYLTDLNCQIMRLLGQGVIEVTLPINLPTQAGKDLVKIVNEIYKYIDEHIAEHRINYDPEHLDDFIDVYLHEMNTKPKPDNTCSYLQEENMRAALCILFLAGADTTSTTLEWCSLYMARYPEIQKKIQEELDSVVGRDRLPEISDQPELPYTRAALLEIQRIVVLTPLSDFHTASADTSLLGYHIPKGATIVSNIYAAMKDPVVFPEPDKFMPERFINEKGQYFEREEVCPFGVGRRICLGENVAKMELFIFFSHLLHRFSLVKPDHAPPITFEGIQGSTFTPKPFEVNFVPRD